MSKVTIEDISRHTGLSRGTVSRALNDRPDISHQTKQKVLEACRQLNYVPSHAARSLATGRSFAVAVLVDSLSGAFAARYLRGVIAGARSQRYAVFVAEIGADAAQAAEHVGTLARERVDGVLVAAPLDAALARPIAEALDRRPLVTSESIPGIVCDVLAPDHVEAGRLVARRMLRGGVGGLLYVHDPGLAGAGQRLAGFEEVLRERQIDPAGVVVEIPPAGAGDGERLAGVRGRLAGVRAVAAASDFLAIEVMLACCQAGRLPGRDIAVLGQGDELVGQAVHPTLTTVDLGAEEIGRRAVELALQRVMKVRQDAPQVTHVAPSLVERESTRSLA